MHGGFRREPGSPPLVYGHRGVRGAAPENTMAAFSLAAEQGADGVELDVRLCASGDLVVAHDPTLARPTGGADPRLVADLPYAELAKADVGGGERVPRLAEVLAFARQRRLRVDVEMKRDVPNRMAVVRATARIVRGVPDAPRWVIVSSFDPAMLALSGLLLPEVPRGFLFEPTRRWLSSGWPAGPIGAIAVHPDRTLVGPETVRAWKRRHLVVNVWTVNHADEARDLAACGVDGLITDVPGEIGAAVRAAVSAESASR
jgi:glycerophosphoryl diester phosphodiesterase